MHGTIWYDEVRNLLQEAFLFVVLFAWFAFHSSFVTNIWINMNSCDSKIVLLKGVLRIIHISLPLFIYFASIKNVLTRFYDWCSEYKILSGKGSNIWQKFDVVNFVTSFVSFLVTASLTKWEIVVSVKINVCKRLYIWTNKIYMFRHGLFSL